jgi:hypothetical protein
MQAQHCVFLGYMDAESHAILDYITSADQLPRDWPYLVLTIPQVPLQLLPMLERVQRGRPMSGPAAILLLEAYGLARRRVLPDPNVTAALLNTIPAHLRDLMRMVSDNDSSVENVGSNGDEVREQFQWEVAFVLDSPQTMMCQLARRREAGVSVGILGGQLLAKSMTHRAWGCLLATLEQDFVWAHCRGELADLFAWVPDHLLPAVADLAAARDLGPEFAMDAVHAAACSKGPGMVAVLLRILQPSSADVLQLHIRASPL